MIPYTKALDYLKHLAEEEYILEPNDTDEEGPPYMCSFSYLHPTVSSEFYHDRACHASLSRFPKGCEYVLSLFNRRNKQDRLSKEYVKWLVCYSPWSSVFLNDCETALNYGFICDTTQPSNYLAGALQVSRQTSRDGGARFIENYWLDLVDYGFNPSLAFLLSFMIKPVVQGADEYWQITFFSTCHGVPFKSALLSITGIKNYLDGKVVNCNKSFKEDTQYSSWFNDNTPYSIDNLWGGTCSTSFDERLREHFETKAKTVQVGNGLRTSTYYVVDTKEEAISIMWKFCVEKLGEEYVKRVHG